MKCTPDFQFPIKKTPEATQYGDRWRAHQKRQQNFVPLGTNFDDAGGWQVVYGGLHVVTRGLADSLPYESDRALLAQGVPLHVPWGKIRLYPVKQHDRYVSGGELWYNHNRIFDVRPFFMQSAARTYAAYGTTDLVQIMNRARDDLARVGLSAYQNYWYRNSAVANYLLNDMKITGIPDIEIPSMPGIPDQCIGCVARGYIPGPIYEYDLVSAFASALLDVPQLADYVRTLDDFRRKLEGTPSAHLIKVTQTVLPGKLLSGYGTEKMHNLRLGLYCRAVTRTKLVNAMTQAVNRGGTVFRWYIDGFYTDVDISDCLELTGALGGWKLTKHDYMLIADTSVFKTNLKFRDNGYTDIDWDAVREDPLRVRVKRTSINWQEPTAPKWLEERTQTLKLLFGNGNHSCDACRGGFHLNRGAVDQYWPGAR